MRVVLTVNNRNKFIFLLIVIQPIIDIVTSISTTYNVSITVGALLRTVIMACLFLYITRYLLHKKKRMLWMFIASYMAILIMMLVTITLKQDYDLFQELNFALKTSYYLTMIYTALILINSNMISKQLLYQSAKMVSLMIGISFWLAIVTKTSINSYRYESVGYSGWFSSANELSVIVLVLLALMAINLTYERTLSSWAAFVLNLGMVPMIGTKTAFLGGLFILFVCVAYLLFRFKLQRDKLVFLSIVAIFVSLVPLSPIASNTQNPPGITGEVVKAQESATGNQAMQKILSSRNLYFQEVREDFVEAQGIRKVFGLGYAGDYSNEVPKLVEMDFFDLFFSYGMLGSVLLLIPSVYLFIQFVKGIFPLDSRKTLALFTLCICLGVAFLAGHVLFAPSVMTYVTILLIALGSEIRRNDGVTNATT